MAANTNNIVEDLTEDERYLNALLCDESGLDLAEFSWIDEENEEGCWRAWPYQWRWFRCSDRNQIDQCGRSVGKSLSITLRGFAFPFVHPGQEMLVTAPELVHLKPVVLKIEDKFYQTRLGRFMLVKGRSAVTHVPFTMNFRNGAKVHGRIPQRDGRGVKGMHPLWLEMDEAQDYPQPGWTELRETLKRGSVGAVWRSHGVTRGVRDEFFKATQPSSHWTVHRYTAMHRPSWTDEERTEAIAGYGGRDDPEYRRNILGAHGDATSPLFPFHKLMSVIDDVQESAYNQEEYVHFKITDSWLRETGNDIEDELPLPSLPMDGHRTYWAGMDVGMTNHPSEILVFAEERLTATQIKDLDKRKRSHPANSDIPWLKLVLRINLTRIPSPDQKRVIMRVLEHYKPKAYSFDKTGVGLPMFQDIQEEYENADFREAANRIKGYNFSGKILVDFDRTIEVDPDLSREELAQEIGIMRNTVEYATDKLRWLIDNGRFHLPWDMDIIGEFQGQTYKITKTTMDQYGKREYSMGKFHALDAARMAVLGWAQYSIEELMASEPDEPVLDMFLVD